MLDADAYPVRLLLSALGLRLRPGHHRLLAAGAARPRARADRCSRTASARVVGAAAVLRHLAARHAPDWRPASPGPGDSWLATLTSPRFAPRQARLLALFTEAGAPPGLVEEAALRLQDLDDHLTLGEFDGQPCVRRRRPTIVDVAAFGPVSLSSDYGVEHDAYPALRRWITRFRAPPGFLPMPGDPAVLLVVLPTVPSVARTTVPATVPSDKGSRTVQQAAVDAVIGGLERAGVSVVCYLPDSLFKELYPALDADPDLVPSGSPTKGRAPPICGGVFLSGKRAALIMENSGLRAATEHLAKARPRCGHPGDHGLMSYRGELGENNWWRRGFVSVHDQRIPPGPCVRAGGDGGDDSGD